MRPASKQLWSVSALFLFVAGLSLRAQQPASGIQAGARPQPAAESKLADSSAAIGDAERSAIRFLAYDLDVHLRPESAGISVVARVTVRNDGAKPLPEIALEISSLLHWDVVSQTGKTRTEKLPFDQHSLQTDADHSGAASEAVIHLLAPLQPQGSAELTLLYSGALDRSAPDAERVSSSRAGDAATDWSMVAPEGTSLRGFGDTLWYPVAAPQVFLGEGAGFLHVAGEQMLHQSAASMRLRVSVEYAGEPPTTAFFCGRQQQLTVLRDDPDAPVASSSGVATATFPAQRLGFRTPSLFLTDTAPVLAAGGLVAAVSSDADLPARLFAAAAPADALLNAWFGKSPGRVLTVIDRPGPPFADGDLLVAPVRSMDATALASAPLASLTRTAFRSAQIWLDQGMPQFTSLLWLEATQGRPAAVGVLEQQSHALALAESMAGPDSAAQQSLLAATDAVYYRNKASSVLWMLREIVGDDVLKQTLGRYVRETRRDADGDGFERLIEKISGKDLRWFFDDWVYHDRGLPDLSILSVAPRELPQRSAQGEGWLVAVEVRNDGSAVAEVPVTIRSGSLTATERLRIPAHSVASTRILFQGRPEQVQVNDGSVPEAAASTHVRNIAMR